MHRHRHLPQHRCAAEFSAGRFDVVGSEHIALTFFEGGGIRNPIDDHLLFGLPDLHPRWGCCVLWLVSVASPPVAVQILEWWRLWSGHIPGTEQ